MEQMKQALLAVSFGSSVKRARSEIEQVEKEWAAQAPTRDFYRAYTSPTIRNILAREGEIIWDLSGALENLAKDGYEDVAVPVTHFLYGFEYDRIREQIGAFNGRFQRLRLGRPLVADSASLRKLADCILQTYPVQDSLVLLGHGTDHFANMVYPALQTALRLAGGRYVYVGTVEGFPSWEDVRDQLRQDGRRQVTVAPLMLVAGDHALHDMAGQEPDSWKSRLEAEGFAVQCHMQGLGSIPGIQRMYEERLQEILRPEEKDGL